MKQFIDFFSKPKQDSKKENIESNGSITEKKEYLSKIPTPIFLNIFNFLDWRTIAKFQQTNKKFYQTTKGVLTTGLKNSLKSEDEIAKLFPDKTPRSTYAALRKYPEIRKDQLNLFYGVTPTQKIHGIINTINDWHLKSKDDTDQQFLSIILPKIIYYLENINLNDNELEQFKKYITKFLTVLLSPLKSSQKVADLFFKHELFDIALEIFHNKLKTVVTELDLRFLATIEEFLLKFTDPNFLKKFPEKQKIFELLDNNHRLVRPIHFLATKRNYQENPNILLLIIDFIKANPAIAIDHIQLISAIVEFYKPQMLTTSKEIETAFINIGLNNIPKNSPRLTIFEKCLQLLHDENIIGDYSAINQQRLHELFTFLHVQIRNTATKNLDWIVRGTNALTIIFKEIPDMNIDDSIQFVFTAAKTYPRVDLLANGMVILQQHRQLIPPLIMKDWLYEFPQKVLKIMLVGGNIEKFTFLFIKAAVLLISIETKLKKQSGIVAKLKALTINECGFQVALLLYLETFFNNKKFFQEIYFHILELSSLKLTKDKLPKPDTAELICFLAERSCAIIPEQISYELFIKLVATLTANECLVFNEAILNLKQYAFFNYRLSKDLLLDIYPFIKNSDFHNLLSKKDFFIITIEIYIINLYFGNNISLEDISKKGRFSLKFLDNQKLLHVSGCSKDIVKLFDKKIINKNSAIRLSNFLLIKITQYPDIWPLFEQYLQTLDQLTIKLKNLTATLINLLSQMRNIQFPPNQEPLTLLLKFSLSCLGFYQHQGKLQCMEKLIAIAQKDFDLADRLLTQLLSQTNQQVLLNIMEEVDSKYKLMHQENPKTEESDLTAEIYSPAMSL